MARCFSRCFQNAHKDNDTKPHEYILVLWHCCLLLYHTGCMIFAAVFRCLMPYKCHNNDVKMMEITESNRQYGRGGSSRISGMFSFLSGMSALSIHKKPPKISRLLMS